MRIKARRFEMRVDDKFFEALDKIIDFKYPRPHPETSYTQVVLNLVFAEASRISELKKNDD